MYAIYLYTITIKFFQYICQKKTKQRKIYAIFLSSFACSIAISFVFPLAILAISFIVSSSLNLFIVVFVLFYSKTIIIKKLYYPFYSKIYKFF